jgi:hypothetical protein
MRKVLGILSLALAAGVAGSPAALAGPTPTGALYGCDFNGDGKADIASNGATNIRIQLLDGNTATTTGFVSNGGGTFTLAGCGDLEQRRQRRSRAERQRNTRVNLMNGDEHVAGFVRTAATCSW